MRSESPEPLRRRHPVGDERPSSSEPVPSGAAAVAGRRAPSSPGGVLTGVEAQALIDELASRQFGVVSRAQLRRAGVPAHVIDRGVRRSRLRTLHPGVYRVGPAAVPLEREMAAVLACGQTAVLSGTSAGARWGLVRSGVESKQIEAGVEISVRDGRRVRLKGVQVRRLASLRDDEVTTFRGIPITTAARTILDLAATLAPRPLEQALARGVREGVVVLGDVARLLKRHPWRRGVRTLRGLLALQEGPALTRSEAEELFLALIRAARLPEPALNVRVAGLEVDFLWRALRVVVEIDGYAYHGSRRAFERDVERDRVLRVAGFIVVRFSARQLGAEREAVLGSVAWQLGHASALQRS